MELQGKTAVVTGGANGIGRALALGLGGAGANVVVSDIEIENARTVAREVEALGVKSLAVQTDVSDEASVQRLADEAWSAFGGVDVLCNNAGVMVTPKRLWEFTASDFEWLTSVNLGGVLNGIRAFVPRMIEAGTPAWIVNTGSEHSLGVPHLLGGIYTASKHGVLALSDVLRRELPPHVGVSIVCPGIVSSTLWKVEERRPDRHGGSVATDAANGGLMEQHGMPAEEVATRVLEGIRDETFYVMTHPHVAGLSEERATGVAEAFATQAPRHEGDDRYDLNAILAKLRGK